ncbi:hypothetical protein CYMTET_30131, partial [Cymbomonas tetramitiformis]
MKVLVECLGAPKAAKDRAAVQQLSATAVQRRWEVRRFNSFERPQCDDDGKCVNGRRHAGEAVQTGTGPSRVKVLPYMDDILLLESSKEAYQLPQCEERVSKRSGLRNDKKGQWEPAQALSARDQAAPARWWPRTGRTNAGCRELEAIADEAVILPRQRDLFAPSRAGLSCSDTVGEVSEVAKAQVVNGDGDVEWRG